MILKELLEKIMKIKNTYGDEFPIVIFGIYSSRGDIEDIYFDEENETACLISDIMSG